MNINPIEVVAVIAGIVHVFLLTKGRVEAWPFGILSVALYIVIFQEARLYSDMLLHGIYVVLNFYGWWRWRKGSDEREYPVSYMAWIERGVAVMLIILATIALGYVMDVKTDADFPFPDAFTTCASLVAQYLLAVKKRENWLIWMVVDVVAIYIYLIKGLYFTSGLYGVYLILSIIGWRKWAI